MRNRAPACAVAVRFASVVAAALALQPVVVVVGQPPYYAEEMGWHFRNFRTDPLPWETYRDTFLGIPPTRDPVSSAFDVLFYDYLYKSGLSEPGNCYGMALHSLLMIKNGGHLGFCPPVPQYSGDLVRTLPDPDGSGPKGPQAAGPTDPRLTRVINQLHGHQVNTETLRFILDRIASGNTRNGNFAFNQFQYYRMRDDPTLVNITKSLLPTDGGHTMVAYDAKKEAGRKLIFVYDPNRPWPLYGEDYYKKKSNVITIEKSGEWSFIYAGGEIWSGRPSEGGHIVILPISVTGPLGRVPTSLGLNALTAVTTLFVFAGDGELKQATSAGGKRLYRPGTREVDTDPATGMRTVLPWFPSDAPDDTPRSSLPVVTYFLFDDPGRALELEISHSGDEYGVRMIGPQGSVEILGRGAGKRDRLVLAGVGGPAPSVRLAGDTPYTYDVLFTQVSQPGERVRQLAVRGLAVSGGQRAPVTLALAEGGAALAVTSGQVPVSFDLELRKQTLYGAEALKPIKVDLKSGESRLIQPDTWTDLTWAKLKQRAGRGLPPG